MNRKRVGVLGATGIVGQRLVGLLRDHPNFELALIAASPDSSGRAYGAACKHLIDQNATNYAHDYPIRNVAMVSANASSVDLVFSALPSDIAGELETRYARFVPVVSKASNHRLDPDVPLIVPELNPDHLKVIENQRAKRNTEGFITTDPNCSTVQLAITLRPLTDRGCIETVVVSTAQALSGAGIPGLLATDMQNNIVPFIKGEEEKLSSETPKILGDVTERGEIAASRLNVVASCKRADVVNGHLEDVFVQFRDGVDLDRVREALGSFQPHRDSRGLHSAPARPIVMVDEIDRPQPKLDVNSHGGMAVMVGRLRRNGNWISYTCLADNTIRGAAGNAILHAELLLRKGLV